MVTHQVYTPPNISIWLHCVPELIDVSVKLSRAMQCEVDVDLGSETLSPGEKDRQQ